MGVFDNAGARAWAVGIIALVLAVMVIAVGSLQDSQIPSITDTTVTNETLTLDNGTAVSLVNEYTVSVTEVLVEYTTNVWTVLSPANYTNQSLNDKYNAGTITLINNVYDGNTSRVTYTYKDLDSQVAYNITQDGIVGAQNITSYFGTIGTLIGVALIVIVVLLAFAVLGFR